MGKKLTVLVVFSVAFAFTEAMVAFYLKMVIGLSLFNFFANYPPDFNLGFIGYTPLINSVIPASLLLLETRRETATIIVLFGVAFLAGKNFRQKLGAFLISFALWDIFYYVFLKIITDWPQNIWNMDVIAITPGVWVAPVINAIFVSFSLFLLGLKLFFSKTK